MEVDSSAPKPDEKEQKSEEQEKATPETSNKPSSPTPTPPPPPPTSQPTPTPPQPTPTPTLPPPPTPTPTTVPPMTTQTTSSVQIPNPMLRVNSTPLIHCDGSCLRAFHARCLGLVEVHPPWLCNECRSGIMIYLIFMVLSMPCLSFSASLRPPRSRRLISFSVHSLCSSLFSFSLFLLSFRPLFPLSSPLCLITPLLLSPLPPRIPPLNTFAYFRKASFTLGPCPPRILLLLLRRNRIHPHSSRL